MPEYRRVSADGGTFFLTLCLNNRRSDLLVREIALLRASWRACVKARPFETIAAVVLPDHMHFLWTLPDDDHDFPTRVAQLKAGFTRALPETLKGSGRKRERGVWQSRFWEHCIRDDEVAAFGRRAGICPPSLSGLWADALVPAPMRHAAIPAVFPVAGGTAMVAR